MDRDRAAVELSEVPFFPQNRYQCGPAALATVLVASGVDITPERLVPEVYLPSRRGSLQIELKAAARRHGRLPYELAPELEVLLDTVAAGMPVLVLQNLGFSWLPRWHYAVVVGYDPGRSAVLLRSGRERRRAEPVNRFQRTWSLADRWAIVALRPGEVPAMASPSTYLETVVEAGGALPAAAIGEALDAGVASWPADADLAFAAGNQARTLGNVDRASDLYRRALALDAGHLGALNNYADLLREAGCPDSALEVIERALRLAGEESALRPVLEATRGEIIGAAAVGGDRCGQLQGPGE